MHPAVTLLAITGLATFLTATLHDSSAEFRWLDDLEAARTLAVKESKPLLLAFR